MGAMLVAVREMASGTDAGERAGACLKAAPREATGSGGLVSRLRGVPKGALKTVLGKELGTRAWQETQGKVDSGTVPDGEIVARLMRHLSQQAADDLRANDRQAKFVRLTACYQDGGSASERVRLPGLTREAGQIFAAAAGLFAGFQRPPGQVSSLNLDVTAAASDVADAARRVPAWLAVPVRTTAG